MISADAIRPGARVNHVLQPPSTKVDRIGVVVMVGREVWATGERRYADVRWIDPDGDASDGTVRHDPSELEVRP